MAGTGPMGPMELEPVLKCGFGSTKKRPAPHHCSNIKESLQIRTQVIILYREKNAKNQIIYLSTYGL